MKTDESLTFDYLNPDFSILGQKNIAFVTIPPEHAFYLKHRVVHWFNQINNSFDPENNFESMNLNRYMIGHSKTVIASYGTRNSAGNVKFNYDKNNKFMNFTFEDNRKLYANYNNFPKSAHLFEVSFHTNDIDEIIEYRISRLFDLEEYVTDRITELSLDDIRISYIFDVNGNKKQDLIKVYDDDSSDIMISYPKNEKQLTEFEDFFHEHFQTILNSLPTFFELYPQFEMTSIKGSQRFEAFYLKFKELYQLGIFNEGFEDNMNVIEMASV